MVLQPLRKEQGDAMDNLLGTEFYGVLLFGISTIKAQNSKISLFWRSKGSGNT